MLGNIYLLYFTKSHDRFWITILYLFLLSLRRGGTIGGYGEELSRYGIGSAVRMLLIWKILWPGISPIWKLFKTLVALWVWRKNTCASCPWISHHLSSNGFATWSWRRRWNWFLGWAGGEMGIMSSYSSKGPSNRFFAGMDISWCSWDPIYDPLMHLGVGFTSQGSYTIMFPQKALIEYWVYNKMILQLGNLPTSIRFWEPYILLHITKKKSYKSRFLVGSSHVGAS